MSAIQCLFSYSLSGLLVREMPRQNVDHCWITVYLFRKSLPRRLSLSKAVPSCPFFQDIKVIEQRQISLCSFTSSVTYFAWFLVASDCMMLDYPALSKAKKRTFSVGSTEHYSTLFSPSLFFTVRTTLRKRFVVQPRKLRLVISRFRFRQSAFWLWRWSFLFSSKFKLHTASTSSAWYRYRIFSYIDSNPRFAYRNIHSKHAQGNSRKETPCKRTSEIACEVGSPSILPKSISFTAYYVGHPCTQFKERSETCPYPS